LVVVLACGLAYLFLQACKRQRLAIVYLHFEKKYGSEVHMIQKIYLRDVND
jgi:hypothetical protein